MLTLRPYQEDALAAVERGEARGLRRMMVAMATGTGKTPTLAHLIKRRGGRAVVLAHRDELVQQARAKIRAVLPETTIGIVRGDQDEFQAQVVVASVQTLARPARLERLLAAERVRPSLFGGQLGPIRTVIADEAHHYVAGDDGNTFGRVMEGLGCPAGATDGPLAVGFTATPERADKRLLSAYWQDIVYELGILDAIRMGCLVNLRAIEVQLACDFNQLHTRSGDIVAGEAGEMLHAADAPAHALAAYLEHAAGRKAILFTPTIALAREMAEAFTAGGVPAEALHGGMEVMERRAALERLKTGRTMVACNAALLTEGFDEPSVSCVVIARPTKSRVLAMQMIGRGTRPYPGKDDCLVLDVVGSTTRTDLMSMAALFSITKKQASRGVREALAEGDGAGQAEDQQRRDGRLVYREVDLLGGRFAWIRTVHEQFTLSMGDKGAVTLAQRRADDEASWEVVRTWRNQEGDLCRKAVAAGLTLGYAQGVAEARLRKVHGLVTLNSGDARWRRGDPSDAQRRQLVRLGIWRDDMTKGEASDALTAHLAVPV